MKIEGLNQLLPTIDQGFEAGVTLLERTLFFQIGGMPLIVLWLVLGSAYLTLRMGFINVRGLGHSVRVLRGDYDDPNEVGEVSHFQAVATALSATVGLGNIAGVAIALQLGGPGAVLWMTVAGLLGMTTKFTECTLAQQYRIINDDGQVQGGPMYYLGQGLAERGLKPMGQLLAVTFAALCMVGVLGGSNMFQSNQSGMAVAALGQRLHWSWLSDPRVYGFGLALTVAAVVIGGLRRIAQVAATVVPTMVVLYLAAALWIVAHHLHGIPGAMAQIWQSAWHPSAVEGGVIGVMLQGLQRGVFSNGAGNGCAGIAHATTKNSEPVREGLVALIEPLIDTVIICNLTALVCLLTGVYEPGSAVSGIELTTAAFASDIPLMSWGLTLIVCLFSFSTIISCYYYGATCWQYLFGQRSLFVYKLIYILSCFGGTVIHLDTVIRFSDVMVFTLAIPNMLGLLLLSNQVAHSLEKYWQPPVKSAVQSTSATNPPIQGNTF
ncbi:alanine/glycine:cation symporter family protein [Leptothoe kymatousa]|uniref:Alanine:cation symporter family protein n=1 Tax=Leptothoe kymatousa TAU-MAC 1615 TaxID=2364775 RepID=A0ABS5Y349_9CYAN|nr:alanine/glycine:cation symporter family protein [Leptothoe kymatousa]MBT9311410.1 alanine:cation symporter family protein [Leptothoe kymatousa TAU-MAC 1615]